PLRGARRAGNSTGPPLYVSGRPVARARVRRAHAGPGRRRHDFEAMTTHLRETGLGVLGDMPWGTHCCHFFQTRKDLVETAVPFFKAGLESREFCLWLIHAPLTDGCGWPDAWQRQGYPPSLL